MGYEMGAASAHWCRSLLCDLLDACPRLAITAARTVPVSTHLDACPPLVYCGSAQGRSLLCDTLRAAVALLHLALRLARRMLTPGYCSSAHGAGRSCVKACCRGVAVPRIEAACRRGVAVPRIEACSTHAILLATAAARTVPIALA